MTNSDLWHSDPARAATLAEEEVRRSDAFIEAGRPVIVERLTDALRNWHKSAKIRCPDGATPLTKDELKALGLRGGLKMDRAFWGALSPAGQADPSSAAEVLYHRARVALYFEGQVRSFRAMGIQTCSLLSVGDDRDCAHAKRVNRKPMKVADLKTWPPAECDAPWCRCVLQAKLF